MQFAIAPVGKFAVEGVGNYFLTGKAAKSDGMRIALWKPKAGEDPSIYSDARFAGSLLGALGAVVGGNVGGGAGKYVAGGGEILLNMTGHSLIATEAVRMAAKEAQAASGVAPGSPRGVYRLGADEAAADAAAYHASAYGYR